MSKLGVIFLLLWAVSAHAYVDLGSSLILIGIYETRSIEYRDHAPWIYIG